MEDVLVPGSLFFMIGWIVWVLFSSIRRYKIAKFQADVQSRLLQRLDSSQSLLAYVETPAGKQFVEGLSTERVTPYERILSSTQAAIIITAFRNYGIILADNGMSGGLIGTPDVRWNDNDLACLTSLTLSNFEPVNVSSLMVTADSGQTSH